MAIDRLALRFDTQGDKLIPKRSKNDSETRLELIDVMIYCDDVIAIIAVKTSDSNECVTAETQKIAVYLPLSEHTYIDPNTT